jgi:hypothetical protein
MIETHDIARHLLLEEREVLVQDLCLQVDGARHLARHNSIHQSDIYNTLYSDTPQYLTFGSPAKIQFLDS